MRDLARAAGLSQPAVSMALRRHPRIAPATCDRVLGLAKKLGYRPNPLVSALMGQLHGRRRSDQSPVIAEINAWPPERDPWNSPTLFAEFRQGARERAAELGFVMESFRYGRQAGERRHLERLLAARGIEGVFVVPVPNDLAVELTWERVAAATLGHSLTSPRLHRAAVDQYANTWNLLEALRARGLWAIGLAQSRAAGDRLQHAWLGAFEAWARLHPELTVPALVFDPSDARAVDVWLRRSGARVVVHHEEEVGRAIRRLPARQRPEAWDLGLYGKSARCGIDPCRAAVGAAVVDLIVAQLNRNERGLPAVPKTLLIEGRVVG